MTASANIYEVNFDCLVGPSHHFGGLSQGNLASSQNKNRISHPKKAALQGLLKMKTLHDKGFKQAILPPHYRPHFNTLRRLGYSKEAVCRKSFFKNNHLDVMNNVCSSSFMWSANAATISPSIDSKDGKVHITVANLASMFHRSIESEQTYKVFKKIFNEERLFRVHRPLPSHDMYSDEGAANHNRVALKHHLRGLQIFVYGKKSSINSQKASIFPARQSGLACEAIKRLHKLNEKNTLLVEQNPLAIDCGAFHNDVVAVANENCLLVHERAFYNQSEVLKNIAKKYRDLFGQEPCIIEINEKELPLKDSIDSYLFNSQLLTKNNGSMLLFSANECFQNKKAKALIEKILRENNPINEVEFIDLGESMANGGGPACLRLRVLLNDDQLSAIHRPVLFDEKIYKKLKSLVEHYYVEELHMDDLFDENFLRKSIKAVDDVYDLLGLSCCRTA